MNTMDENLKNKEQNTVLVTAIGTITATCIVDELAKYPMRYKILGTDINERNEIATSLKVNEYYRFPLAIENQDAYREFVLKFCIEHHVDYLFAVIDEEVVNFSNHKEEFESIGVKLCLPNKEFVNTCHYKNKFAEWIKCNMPEIEIESFKNPSMVKDSDFPLFIKPIEGRASNGCKVVKTRTDLNDAFAKGNYVIQKFETGNIITVDILRNKATGQIFQIQRQELLRNKNGCGIAVEIIQNEDLQHICERLAEALNLNGVVNAEFFESSGKFKIIEINPRFSAGTSYSCLSGCNTVINAIYIADGLPCQSEKIQAGKHYARRYETYEL